MSIAGRAANRQNKVMRTQSQSKFEGMRLPPPPSRKEDSTRLSGPVNENQGVYEDASLMRNSTA